uniref:Uncharacterized protein n=1 Tax=Romanomermis culicivorax TaxID=13658 RepID=A0A915ILA6_ROMCU
MAYIETPKNSCFAVETATWQAFSLNKFLHWQFFANHTYLIDTLRYNQDDDPKHSDDGKKGKKYESVKALLYFDGRRQSGPDGAGSNIYKPAPAVTGCKFLLLYFIWCRPHCCCCNHDAAMESIVMAKAMQQVLHM